MTSIKDRQRAAGELASNLAQDLAVLVRDLRTEGKSEATIVVVLGVTARVHKYAARRLGWAGTIPTTLMLSSERPNVTRAVYVREVADARRRAMRQSRMDAEYASVLSVDDRTPPKGAVGLNGVRSI